MVRCKLATCVCCHTHTHQSHHTCGNSAKIHQVILLLINCSLEKSISIKKKKKILQQNCLTTATKQAYCLFQKFITCDFLGGTPDPFKFRLKYPGSLIWLRCHSPKLTDLSRSFPSSEAERIICGGSLCLIFMETLVAIEKISVRISLDNKQSVNFKEPSKKQKCLILR